MLREYPVKKATSAPATGRLFYEFLMSNIKIPASANHMIWYMGEKAKLARPDKFTFRGDLPVGKTLELVSLQDNPIDGGKPVKYTFTGNEGPVLVSDLAESALFELSIPLEARKKDKVFNPNFKTYDQLPELTRLSNELAVLSVPKSISSFFAGVRGKVNYSERDVLGFLEAACSDAGSPEMVHLLHGNHLAWSALAYIRAEGNVAGDLMAEFYSQNPTDFYIKDMGTVLPAIYFAGASLGVDPVSLHEKIDVDVWGAREAAELMRQYSPKK